MSPLLVGIMLAASPCGTMQEIATRLASEYQEKPVAVGVSQNGELFSLLASASGTWTALHTMPGGPTCIVDAGRGFQLLPRGEQS